MIKHPRLDVIKTTGSEGPHHDPYAYTEWHVTTDKHEVILHTGLGMWIKFDGTQWGKPADMDYDAWEKHMYEVIFPQYVGFTVEQLERIYRRLDSRCKSCGGTDFTWESGYPGEELKVCVDCNHINGGTFDRSAVE
jgi:hypothetical protein